MNSTENIPENTPADQSRPFGFWITAVDRLLAAEFATAFEDEGITRRDWRILNAVDGTVPLGRDLPDSKVRHLVALGWVEQGSDGWTLTADGTAAKARLTAAVDEIRAQVAGALDPEEFAAMAAALEKLARGLGYEEGKRLPRRHVGGRSGVGREWPHREHLRHEHLRQEHLRHEHRCGGHTDGERLHREHARGEHPFRGRGPEHGAPGHSPAHLHIHLHDGRHRNG